jgi:hypothetical protein
MKPYLLLLLLFAFCLPAQARIGETREQVEARLGKPIGYGKNSIFIYQKNDFGIHIRYFLDKVVRILYMKIQDGVPFTSDEVSTLLNNNGTDWKNVKTNQWETPELVADYVTSGHALIIQTKDFKALMDKQKQGLVEGL